MLLNILLVILLADLMTGFAHWAEDTYCYKGIWPEWLDRSICAPVTLHHINQTDCLKYNFLENVKISYILALFPSALALYFGLYILGSAMLLAPLGAQIHIYTHQRSRLSLIRLLQEMNILQTPAHHARHHKWPHITHYCSITNWLNPILDLGFWRALEWALFKIFGLKVKQLRVIEDEGRARKFKIDPTRLN